MSAYFDITKVKPEIDKEGTTEFDDLLTQFGQESDTDINQMVYPYVASVPVTPAPQILKDASNLRIIAKWYKYNRNMTLYKTNLEESDALVNKYIASLQATGEAARSPQKFTVTAGTSLGDTDE